MVSCRRSLQPLKNPTDGHLQEPSLCRHVVNLPYPRPLLSTPPEISDQTREQDAWKMI